MKHIRNLIPGFVLLSLVSLGGCAKDSHESQFNCRTSSIPCLDKVSTVLLETTRGAVLISIDGPNAPLTAGNFVDLVRKGVYNQTVFHRVVRSPVPFVVQGGDPISADPKVPASAYGTGNYIDPKSGEARMLPLEFKDKASKRWIYGRELTPPIDSVRPALVHERGAVAMARSADPNSASAQFYIALEALPELDGRYAVFGRVTNGMDVVDRLQQGDKLIRASVKD